MCDYTELMEMVDDGKEQMNDNNYKNIVEKIAEMKTKGTPQIIRPQYITFLITYYLVGDDCNNLEGRTIIETATMDTMTAFAGRVARNGGYLDFDEFWDTGLYNIERCIARWVARERFQGGRIHRKIIVKKIVQLEIDGNDDDRTVWYDVGFADRRNV